MKALLLAVGLAGGITLAMADPAPSAAPPSSPQAEQAWAQVKADETKLRAAEQTRQPSAITPTLAPLRGDVATFIKQFPGDAHTPEARLMAAQLGRVALALDLPDAPTAQELQAEFKALATDASLPTNVRVSAAVISAREIFASVASAAEANPHDPVVWDTLETKISAFEKNTGNGPGQEPAEAAVVLRHTQITLLQQAGETERLKALMVQLEKSSNPQMVAMAQSTEASIEAEANLKTKPLDLHFTALDGSAVDLARMRGKVVLLDFWATWCPPCRGETPTVVAAYQKYHGKGFEIVGISLDQDKGALTKYIADNHMPWPQYFDGKGWNSDVGQRFGINSIPAMWLIGKDGLVATQDGRDDLDGQVSKLLAAP